jgi:hypothetical protein
LFSTVWKEDEKVLDPVKGMVVELEVELVGIGVVAMMS